MRLICLLLAGIVLLFSSCQSTRLQPLLKQHPYDTLEKYSYLLVALKKSQGDSTKVKPITNGTGFFYRKDEKLFLVSAYHVLTGCSNYNRNMPDQRPDSMDIWFFNEPGKGTYIRLSMDAYRAGQCETADKRADVDTMDVTAWIKNVKVSSVERLTCGPCGGDDTLRKRDTVVCYGYSNFQREQYNYGPASVPSAPNASIGLGRKIPGRDGKTKMKDHYYFIHPKLHEGDSGGPVFRIRSDANGNKIVGFMGIQSGSKENGNRSTITKQIEMMRLLDHLK